MILRFETRTVLTTKFDGKIHKYKEAVTTTRGYIFGIPFFKHIKYPSTIEKP